YPSFRRLAGLLALMTAIGSWAAPALRAQDRTAAPVAGQAPANASAPARHWWESPQPAPSTPTPPAGAIQPTSAPAPGPNIFRIKHDKPGDSKPVILDADEVASWTEKNGSTEYFVFLLHGLVLAQQGIVEARFPHGVAWVNVTQYKM